ncbi:hypothetical protein RvY_13178 [Ramazzottius varieornatus]|uniref:Large ribosomal subunit protein bL32m n=1 Tax=Ramazzottius varieornatus TaxID=947166 RepID=A0A1D1VVK8_RAMVA|nr:hypothetical protein RvY_13178 [Ramazzottius varieornatus]
MFRVKLDLAVRRVEALLDIFMGKPFPGLPQLATVEQPSAFGNLQSHPSSDGSQKSFLESLKDGIFWGVPKKRKSWEKRHVKQFGLSYMRPWRPRTDLITCLHCGNTHEAHTVCGACYAKVKEETARIQAAMDIKARVPDHQEVVVVYEGEATDPTTIGGKKVIAMPTNRPSWFHDILMTKITPDNKPNTVGWEGQDIQEKYKHKYPPKKNY